MKTWLLLSRFERGGLERVQVNLAPALGAAGLDVRIVVGRILPGAAVMLPHGIQVREISPRSSIQFAIGLLSELRRQRPDLVLTTSSDVGCFVLLLRALFFPRMKVVWTQHSSLTAPWQEARGIRRGLHWILLQAIRHLMPKADAVVAVSTALADHMQHFLGGHGKISVIANPVLLPGFSVAMQGEIDWPWPDKSIPTIVFAGRLVGVKRLDMLLEAFMTLQKTHAVRMLILGDGPERQMIQHFVAQHHLGDACIMLGHQDNPLPWIKACNVLVLPSDYEGFGNVLVEAMACGTQVVATNCPYGPAEILDNGRYGQLVPPGDAVRLTDAMKIALSGQFHIPVVDLKTRAEEFSLERAAAAYLRVIESVTGRTE